MSAPERFRPASRPADLGPHWDIRDRLSSTVPASRAARERTLRCMKSPTRFEKSPSLALHPRHLVDVHVRPALRTDRVWHVIAHPRVRERILDVIVRHPPRRIRNDYLGHSVEKFGPLRRIGKAARRLEQLIEFGQIEPRLVLLARVWTVEQLHEIL